MPGEHDDQQAGGGSSPLYGLGDGLYERSGDDSPPEDCTKEDHPYAALVHVYASPSEKRDRDTI